LEFWQDFFFHTAPTSFSGTGRRNGTFKMPRKPPDWKTFSPFRHRVRFTPSFGPHRPAREYCAQTRILRWNSYFPFSPQAELRVHFRCDGVFSPTFLWAGHSRPFSSPPFWGRTFPFDGGFFPHRHSSFCQVTPAPVGPVSLYGGDLSNRPLMGTLAPRG